MKVRVYRNLTRKCFSVQKYIKGKGWRLSFHTHFICLSDVVFKVSEAGRQRVIKTGQKNVHAYVEGTLGDTFLIGSNIKSITYNPYRLPYFYVRQSKAATLRSQYAMLSLEQGILAW